MALVGEDRRKLHLLVVLYPVVPLLEYMSQGVKKFYERVQPTPAHGHYPHFQLSSPCPQAEYVQDGNHFGEDGQ